jgi:uncharacterized protein
MPGLPWGLARFYPTKSRPFHSAAAPFGARLVHGIDGDLYGFLVGDGARHLASRWLARSIIEHMSPHISIDRDAVSAFCRRHHITRLALFGSVLRDDFGPDSDVDVLVEFQAGHVPGFNFVSIEREFSGLLHGRRVDMVTPKFLNPRIRDQVLSSAEPLYVAA